MVGNLIVIGSSRQNIDENLHFVLYVIILQTSFHFYPRLQLTLIPTKDILVGPRQDILQRPDLLETHQGHLWDGAMAPVGFMSMPGSNQAGEASYSTKSVSMPMHRAFGTSKNCLEL